MGVVPFHESAVYVYPNPSKTRTWTKPSISPVQSDERVHRPRRNPRLTDSRWLYGL
ncbi:hypothetical protein BDZ89DRAFT_1069684 [Hymenopellis radicata]|nr:hypothetical protein BDZ89DRAFT_1069684 [Hymenopellis radicata]